MPVDQAVVVFSDIEMGCGTPTDDFPHTDWLAELFLSYNRGEWTARPVDLVLNGDTFDLLKTSINGSYPHLVDSAVAVAKMKRILAAHRPFFAGLRAFLDHPAAPRRVFFTVGNHDFELLFPQIRQMIREAVGRGADRIHFPGLSVDLGDVHIEHGSQADPLFRLEPEHPFIHWQGRSILNLPWGAVALLDVAMPLHDVLYPCDRARPRTSVLTMLPELRNLMLERYWHYWTRDWLGSWWSASDPVKGLSWQLFRQVAARLQSGDASIQLDPRLETEIAEGPQRLTVLGHLHDASWRSQGARKVLRTGCMRDEFLVEDDGRVGRVLPKVYAEVLLRHGTTRRSHLVEVDGPRGAHAAMPASINEVLAHVRGFRPDPIAEAHGALAG